MFRQSTPSPAAEAPRDVEALERVIAVLDDGVVDEHEGSRLLVQPPLRVDLALQVPRVLLPGGVAVARPVGAVRAASDAGR